LRRFFEKLLDVLLGNYLATYEIDLLQLNGINVLKLLFLAE